MTLDWRIDFVRMTNVGHACIAVFLCAITAPALLAQEGIVIHGIAMDSGTHAPLSGASVSAVGNQARLPDKTDQTGRFDIPLIAKIRPGDLIRLRIEKDGYRAYDQKLIASKDSLVQAFLTKSSSAPRSLKPRDLTNLSVVDISVDEHLTVDFKLKNSGTDSAFLTDVSFIFYPGSGVLSGCMPVDFVLYDFPFSAELGGQLVAIAKGTPPKNDFKLPANVKKVLHEEWISTAPQKPYLVTQPLKISQAVPPRGVDRFKVRFVLDSSYSHFGAECMWHEVYEAHAVINYDGSHTLITPKFQIAYFPGEIPVAGKK